MSKSILLLRPNHTNNKRDHYITFPSGLAYIAAVLRDAGHRVKVIDLTIADVDFDELKKKIIEFDPDIYGIGALSHAYPDVIKLTSMLKNVLSRPVILGGHLSSYSYDLVLRKSQIDYCVLGEGERTIVELIENMDEPEKVAGIAYLNEKSQIVLTSQRKLINDLNTLPMPAYDLFKMDEYLGQHNVYMPNRNFDTKGIYRKASIETGRGCPFSCNYCSKLYSNIRKRSIVKILEEIQYLKKHYGINIVRFQDELFFFDKKYVKEFCDEIVKLKVGWSGNARIDTIDKETISYIKNHNCMSVSFGVESGNKQILKNMNKKITPVQIEKTLKECLKQKLPISINLILGYPGETQETVDDTIKLLKRVGYPGTKFHYITPYPGSPLYDNCLEEGIIKDEEKHLLSLADGSGPYRFRYNMTDMSDIELSDLLASTAKKVLHNYLLYLIMHPNKMIAYSCHKDIMNPFWLIYNKIFKPTNYDKAAKKKSVNIK